LLVLIEGTAMRYRVLHDGRRQVLNIIFPGDFIGFPGCFFDRALYSIAALSETVVSAIPFAHVFRLFEAHPRLAATIFWSFSCEAAMSAEHLIDVGRRSRTCRASAARVADEASSHWAGGRTLLPTTANPGPDR
jgi:CRP-like cAMP-binding protein